MKKVHKILTFDEILGQNIKLRREALGITQSDLAKVTGLTIDTISKYETGKRPPRKKNLEDLCRVFKCTREQLMMDVSGNLELLEKESEIKSDSQAIRALKQQAEKLHKENIQLKQKLQAMEPSPSKEYLKISIDELSKTLAEIKNENQILREKLSKVPEWFIEHYDPSCQEMIVKAAVGIPPEAKKQMDTLKKKKDVS